MSANYCKCGCGKVIKPYSKRWKRSLTYAHGHNWKGKSRGGMSLEEKLGGNIPCACGCGEIITQYRLKASGRRYKVKMQKGHMWKGKDSPAWMGGKTNERDLIENTKEYKAWRKLVFERDNYTCVICGIRNGLGKTVELQADHIKSFSKHPELRLSLDNGRTLCRPCHTKTDTFGVNAWRVVAKN